MRERIRQFRELSKLFFGRFLDNDLISLDGDTKGTLLGVLGLIAAPPKDWPSPLAAFRGFPRGIWPAATRSQLRDSAGFTPASLNRAALFELHAEGTASADRPPVGAVFPRRGAGVAPLARDPFFMS